MATRFRVLVVGAGVGGLTAAAALKRAGMEPVIYERRPSLEAAAGGPGVLLWSNAFVALHRLGIAGEVAAHGVPVHAHTYRTWRGRRIGGLDVRRVSNRIGAPTVGVSRPHLHHNLMSLLDTSDVRFHSEIVGFDQNTKRAVLHFADGTSEEGDAVVGADGLHSVIRQQIHGPTPPRYAGLRGWQAVCDFAHGQVNPGEVVTYWGRGARIHYYYVEPGRLFWLALVTTPANTAPTQGGRQATVRRIFDGWPPQVRALLDATDETSIAETPIHDRDPLKYWGQHRVTLVGDAAHPMVPDLAQGAGQAIEDGVALAEALQRSTSPQEGLRAYEHRRMERANGCVNRSRAMARMGGFQAAALRLTRDRVILPLTYGAPAFSSARKNMTAVL